MTFYIFGVVSYVFSNTGYLKLHWFVCCGSVVEFEPNLHKREQFHRLSQSVIFSAEMLQ